METAVPPSTTTPTPAPTLPPPPTGQIIFLWDSESLPEFYGSNPHQALYLAQPGISPEDWNITAILSDLVGFPLAVLSPDQTKLALTVLEDRSNDGIINYGSYQRGGDAYNLYVYSLWDQTMERLTVDYPDIVYISWSPDNQEIAFIDGYTVLSYNLRVEDLQFLAENNTEQVSQIAWSPSGDQLAFKLYSGVLYFISRQTREVVPIPEVEANFNSLGLLWSPDGKWLASNTTQGGGLVIVNDDHNEIIELVPTNFFCNYAWSPIGNNLAFVQSLHEGGASLAVVSDTNNFIPEILFQENSISSPLWTPDGTLVTVGYLNDIESGLLLFDPETQAFQQLRQSDNLLEIQPLAWSPDGEWLLFAQKQTEESGLYLIHRQGGVVYLFLDTTETFDPYAVSWLPENTVEP